MNRLSTTLFLLLAIVCGNALQANDSISYRPNIHGTIRGRLEVSTMKSEYRFQVRNARVSLDGKIAPIADYFIQADFCDRGKIKILDVWARLWATKSVGFQAGQFRMPFGVDPFRAPHTYYFANRSFLGNQVCNFRAVGAKAMWHPTDIPLTLEAGVFNPSTIADHSKWHNTMAYAAKLTYRTGNVTWAAGHMSTAPDSDRFNITDAAVTWKYGRWIAEGEYMYKHYTNHRHRASHAYQVFADYRMPLNTRFFNRLSFQARFDGMTAHSSGTRDANKELCTNHPARNRVTVGTTISYIRSKNMFLDLRANYEKYFYHHGAAITPDNGDKATIELVVRF